MTPEDFSFLCGIIRDRSGLILGADKAYLVESRLAPIARRRQKSLDEIVKGLRRYPDSVLLREITEAMATHETFFFRDTKPFDQFRRLVLPPLLRSRAAERKLRIWSAACSTGQEAYSLAMILREETELLRGWKVEIVGTDFSKDVLSRAERATFSQFEVQRGLPVQLLLKYFQQTGEVWRIDPSIRSAVQFSQQNLLEDLTPLGRFDVVFCRNVLIYFDQKTKADVLTRVSRQMAHDGFLFLGGAETIFNLTDALTPMPGHSGLFSRSAASASSARMNSPQSLPQSQPAARPRADKPGTTGSLTDRIAAARSTLLPKTDPGAARTAR